MDDGIEYEVCLKWFHARCVKISKELFKFIESTPGLHWSCGGCDRSGFKSSTVYFEDLIAKLEGHLNDTID